jgi:hypothetical protein
MRTLATRIIQPAKRKGFRDLLQRNFQAYALIYSGLNSIRTTYSKWATRLTIGQPS